MALPGISNANEFYSTHYLESVLAGDIKKVRERWAEEARAQVEADPMADVFTPEVLFKAGDRGPTNEQAPHPQPRVQGQGRHGGHQWPQDNSGDRRRPPRQHHPANPIQAVSQWKRQLLDGSSELFTRAGRRRTGVPPISWTPRPGARHRPADPGKRMVGRVLTGNGITRYGERDALLQLCRQRLDALHRHSLRR
jgi:hypothetical protein